MLFLLCLCQQACRRHDIIITFMTFLAPCWTLTSWVELGTLVACLTAATFAFVAIAVPGFEDLDLVNGGCSCHSTSCLVPIEVFHCTFMLLGMFKEVVVGDVSVFILLLHPFLDLKVFGCMTE